MDNSGLTITTNIYWHGEDNPPLDRILIEDKITPPNPVIRYSLFTMALLGMLVAFAFFTVNIKFRKTRLVYKSISLWSTLTQAELSWMC